MIFFSLQLSGRLVRRDFSFGKGFIVPVTRVPGPERRHAKSLAVNTRRRPFYNKYDDPCLCICRSLVSRFFSLGQLIAKSKLFWALVLPCLSLGVFPECPMA